MSGRARPRRTAAPARARSRELPSAACALARSSRADVASSSATASRNARHRRSAPRTAAAPAPRPTARRCGERAPALRPRGATQSPITLPRRGACPQAPPRRPERMRLRRPRGRQGRGDLSHRGVEAVRQQQLGVADHPEALAVGATGPVAGVPQRLPGPRRARRARATRAPGTRTSTPCARCPRCRTAPRPPSPAPAARPRAPDRRSRSRRDRPRGRRRSRPARDPGAPRARRIRRHCGSASAGLGHRQHRRGQHRERAAVEDGHLVALERLRGQRRGLLGVRRSARRRPAT